MTTGSGLLTNEQPLIPHHAHAGKEVGDLRRDLERGLASLRARCIAELIDPPAAAVDSVITIGAGLLSSLVEQTILPAVMDGALGPNLGDPRQLSVTTGGVAAQSPASMLVEGKDARGRVISETLVLGQIVGTDTTVKYYTELTRFVLPPGTGVAATFTMGHADPIGLTETPLARAGGVDLLWEKESTLGVVVTGTLNDAATAPPYGSYDPATATDGAEDYAIEYEYDPTV